MYVEPVAGQEHSLHLKKPIKLEESDWNGQCCNLLRYIKNEYKCAYISSGSIL